MRRSSCDFVKWAVLGLVVALSLGTLVRSAEAAVGDVIANVSIPPSANCGTDIAPNFGTALAIVSGGKAGFPAIPTLVVTSCFTPSDGSSQSRLFFLDPSTDPATVVKTLTTSPVVEWHSLALRADTGDLLACHETVGTTTTTSLYAIHFSPFDATPPTALGVATATLLQSGPSGSTCDGIAWDTKDKTIYQTSTTFDTPSGSFNVLHFAPGSKTVTSIPSGCGNVLVGGIGIAGVSLFVGCSQPPIIGSLDLDIVPVALQTPPPASIMQLDKATGTLVTGRSLNLPAGMVDPAGVPDDPSSFGLQLSMKDALWTKDAASSSFFGRLIAVEMAAGTTGQNSGSPLAFPAACDQVTGNAPDTDGDGLLDCWEDGGFWSDGRPGISVDGTYSANRDPSFRAVTLCVDMNGNGVFDAGECASPNHKDIFVEADYMQFHTPDPVAVANVVTAFANAPVANPDGTTGIRLHIQIDDQVPHTTNTALVPCTPPSGVGDSDFDTLKGSFFGTAAERAAPNAAALLSAKRYAYHYVLFVHNQTGSTSSGCAEILGNDLMVSLGSFAVVNSHNVGTTDQQGGTFMHELGHNLNLRHGGFENVNCKPNYTSRMNYAYQFSSPVNPSPLDYSRQALLTLNEASLSETLGVGEFAGKIAFGPPAGIPAKPKVVSATGGIDWNLSGAVSGTAVRDVNSFGIAGCPALAGEILAGFNDWANINFNFRASLDFGDGAHTFETPEITLQEAATISVDTDGDGVNDIDFDPATGDYKGDNCPLTFNPAQNADACAVVIEVLRPIIPSTSTGVVQVAILSSVTRDATMIDPATILLTGAAAQGPGIWSLRVTQNSVGTFFCSKRDVNGDGRLDLVCQFKVDARLLPLGVSNVTLDAMTLGGEAVRGTDTLDVKDVGAGQ